VLRSHLALRLDAIARVFPARHGEVDESRGALELTFEGGRVLHLTTDAGGESLSVGVGAWLDSAGIREHGRWTRVDVSARAGYSDAVGGRLAIAFPVVNDRGSVAGVEMHFGPVALTFVSRGEHEDVVAGPAAALPPEWRMCRFSGRESMTMEA
jgi:hypothetical protein